MRVLVLDERKRTDDLARVSGTFARAVEEINTTLVARGQKLADGPRGASCHVPSLHGQEQMPRLAGQRIDDMLAAMKA